jgi:uncharacterized membrane protein YccC
MAKNYFYTFVLGFLLGLVLYFYNFSRWYFLLFALLISFSLALFFSAFKKEKVG